MEPISSPKYKTISKSNTDLLMKKSSHTKLKLVASSASPSISPSPSSSSSSSSSSMSTNDVFIKSDTSTTHNDNDDRGNIGITPEVTLKHSGRRRSLISHCIPQNRISSMSTVNKKKHLFTSNRSASYSTSEATVRSTSIEKEENNTINKSNNYQPIVQIKEPTKRTSNYRKALQIRSDNMPIQLKPTKTIAKENKNNQAIIAGAPTSIINKPFNNNCKSSILNDSEQISTDIIYKSSLEQIHNEETTPIPQEEQQPKEDYIVTRL
jgi:hypothetical protein